MRSRIKTLAIELLIQNGYRGLRYADIAAALDVSRANIHYHFGAKQNLVDEVLHDYLRETLERFRKIWTDDDVSFAAKIDATAAFNRERYQRFNGAGEDGRPWSLIARMRLDSEVLSAEANAGLKAFGAELYDYVLLAVERARSKGELNADVPVEDVALQLMSIANSAGSITTDAGGFDRLEKLYQARASSPTPTAAGRGMGSTRRGCTAGMAEGVRGGAAWR